MLDAIRKSIQAYLDFQDTMNRIKAVTGPEEVEQAAQRIAALSQTMPAAAAAERVYQEAIRGAAASLDHRWAYFEGMSKREVIHSVEEASARVRHQWNRYQMVGER